MKDKESLNSSLQLQMEGTSSLVLISTSSWNKFSLPKHLEGIVGVKSYYVSRNTWSKNAGLESIIFKSKTKEHANFNVIISFYNLLIYLARDTKN